MKAFYLISLLHLIRTINDTVIWKQKYPPKQKYWGNCENKTCKIVSFAWQWFQCGPQIVIEMHCLLNKSSYSSDRQSKWSISVHRVSMTSNISRQKWIKPRKVRVFTGNRKPDEVKLRTTFTQNNSPIENSTQTRGLALDKLHHLWCSSSPVESLKKPRWFLHRRWGYVWKTMYESSELCKAYHTLGTSLTLCGTVPMLLSNNIQNWFLYVQQDVLRPLHWTTRQTKDCSCSSQKLRYEADPKSHSRPMSIVLLFSQDLCIPIGQQWYQMIEKQNTSIEMCRRKHDQERFLGSASYFIKDLSVWE